MKLGLCEKDLRGRLRDNLEWISRSGFEGFQIWKPRLEKEGLAPREVLAMAGELRLEVTAVGGGPNLVDPRAAERSVELFRGYLELSVELESRIVTAETKAKPEGLADKDAWESTVRAVSRICEHAEKVGAVLAIEPSGSCFIRDCEAWLNLAREVRSERLRVNYDPANIVLAGKEPVAGVRALGGHIVHTHAKDIALAGGEEGPGARDVPAGEGQVGYASYLAALAEAGYDGYLTVEMHAGETDRRDDILRSCANLREMLGGSGCTG